MATHTSFISTLLHKKQQIADTKRIAASRVSAAKYGKMLSPVPTGDVDIFSIPSTNVYMEGLEPSETAPIINQEGNFSEHSDGTFSVTEEDGYVHKGLDEQTARSYRAYTTAKDKAIREDAPERYSFEGIRNRVAQGLVGIGELGYKASIGTGTLRNEIDNFNKGEASVSPAVTALQSFVNAQVPKITEEDEKRFANVNQLAPVEQRLYVNSPKFKILTELRNKAVATKAELDVAEENIANVNEYVPVDRAIEAARSEKFKYVAEKDGLWEATKSTLKNDWDSYLYGGVDAIPYMVILATGNVPVIASLVTSMALGNNVDNTQEFLRLNDGVEPTKDEAARIQLFSAAQAAVDAIGDRLAVVGLPKGVATALSTQLISAKKILASTTKSVPLVFRAAAKIITTPVKMVVTEAPAGAAEEASRQFATGGEISDPAAIVEAAIIEGLASPVGVVGTRATVGTGKAALGIGKRIVGKGDKNVEREARSKDSTYDDTEFDKLLDSIVYVEGNNENNFNTFKKLGEGTLLTAKQEKAYKEKLAKFSVKINGEVDDPKSIDDTGLGSLQNVNKEGVTDADLTNFEKSLTEISDIKYAKTLSKVIAAGKRAAANISDVAKDIRKGTDVGWEGADTIFAEITALVKEMVSAPDPKLTHAKIKAKVNKLQTHSGNLEKKKEAFKKAENYVVDESKKIPESAELVLNEEIKIGETGEVKPRVGTGDPGSAIVIGTTKNRATSYTVYYNQSQAEIADAKIEHPEYVTEVSLLKSGKSSINRLSEIVTEDSEYVDAVATTATAYLESTIYKNTRNKIEGLKNDQGKVAAIAATTINTSVSEATEEDIANIGTEEVTVDAEESAQISADANVTDTDSQTTLTEETSPEGTPVTSQEETTEVLTEGSSAEIQAQIDALVIKKEKAKVREKAKAAEEKTAPIDTTPEETTPPVTEESTAGTTTETIVETSAEEVEVDLEAERAAAESLGVNPESLKLFENTADTKQSAQQSSKISTVSYNPEGKATQTYTVESSKIFNKNNVEVFKEDSVDRNKIFANLAVQEKRAQLVEHKGKKYVVNDKQQIMSVATGKIMKWAENDGNRKAILSQVQPIQQSVQESSEVSYKVENSNFSLLESELDVHTLSVLFPTAINADGTLKTGNTADAAVNKLGKFLEVCK